MVESILIIFWKSGHIPFERSTALSCLLLLFVVSFGVLSLFYKHNTCTPEQEGGKNYIKLAREHKPHFIHSVCGETFNEFKTVGWPYLKRQSLIGKRTRDT